MYEVKSTAVVMGGDPGRCAGTAVVTRRVPQAERVRGTLLQIQATIVDICVEGESEWCVSNLSQCLRTMYVCVGI